MGRKQPMTHNEFNHILTSINALSPDQMRRLARELESRIASTCKPAAPAAADAEESAFDVASRGVGSVASKAATLPDRPDTKPKHMEGFGRE